MTFEERLREAAFRADEAILDSLPDTEDSPVAFLPRFEWKMGRLIHRTDCPVTYVLQQAACIVLVLLMCASLWLAVDVDARAKFFGWLPDGDSEVDGIKPSVSTLVIYENDLGKYIDFIRPVYW